MAVDWDADDVREIRADLAKARASNEVIRIDLAAREIAADGSFRAEPVARIDVTPRVARQMLALLRRLLVDWESAGTSN